MLKLRCQKLSSRPQDRGYCEICSQRFAKYRVWFFQNIWICGQCKKRLETHKR